MTPNAAKFKKGTAVSFEGANHLIALPKTYIHAVATEDGINYYYLIEHPKGVVLCDATRKDFVGYDLTNVKAGLKYIVANETELLDVEIPVKKEPEAPATETAQERDAQELVTIEMPYYQWLAIMGGLQTSQVILQQNKVMVMLQPDMTEEIYNEQVKGNLDAQKSLEAAGI